MLKALAIIGGLIVVGVAGILGYAATRPDTFRVERSTRIAAPPEKIFALIQDFRAWPAWSPYETLDPAMRRSLSGRASGKGAVYAWDSSGSAGQGRMEITEVTPPDKVTIALDFTRPMEANNIVEFTLVRDGPATTVTWAMHGASPFVAKVMQVFVSMDSLVGKDFETGLANLKRRAEG